MKQVIATATLAAALALGTVAPVRADQDAGAYQMQIYMEMLMKQAMDGHHAVTADPRGMSYDDYMNKEGEAANAIMMHFFHVNDSATGGEIDALQEAMQEHLVNAAESWMTHNPGKVSEMTVTDWITLEDLKTGTQGLTPEEIDAMVERGLAGYLAHQPDQ